jgi:O-antigen/teichoic acid export membrane protein
MMGIMEISAQVLLAVLGFSLYNAYFRWYWDSKYLAKQKSILFTIIVFLFFQFIIFFILLFTFQKDFSLLLFDTYEQTYLIRLLLYVNCLETVGILISTLLRLKEKAIYYTILQLIKLTVSLVITIYLIKYRQRNIEAVYEALLIANILYFILIFNLVRKNIVVKLEFKILKEMLSFSLPLVLTSISGIILNITDRFSLKFLTDLGNVGIYSLGFKVANTIRVFIITSINLALQPMIYKMMDAPNNKRFYSKVMTYYTYGLMFAVLFISMFSAEIIKTISKNMDYWDAYKIIPILCFSILFSMLRDVALTGLNINKKTKIIAVLIITASLINILLNILLIPHWGYFGAAIATTISQMLFFIFVFIAAQRFFPIPYELKKVFMMIVIAVAFYFIASQIEPYSLPIRLIVKFFLIALFPIILYPLGFYEKIEIIRLREFWKKWRNPSEWSKNLSKIKLN